MTAERPYRLVDADNQGWLAVADGLYQPDYGRKRFLDNMTLDEITQQRGPWRPVEPITTADEQTLTETFRRCGSKTVTTLAAALDEVFHALREAKGGLADPHGSYDYARRTLMAGREGSWESEDLIRVALFGNGLNITKRGPVHTVNARRAAGPSKRVDRESRDTIAAMIRRWVTDPARYTEVAETLAEVVSRYADEAAGPDGWKAVADRWLRPGGLARDDFAVCYRLLYGRSEYFNAGLL